MEQKDKGVVRRFFAALWRFVGWVRVSLSNLVFLVMLLVVVALLARGGPPAVPAKGALVINPSGVVVEQLGLADPLAQLFGSERHEDRETLLKDLLDAIGRARTDDRIELIVIATDSLHGAGLTRIRDIAQALQAFRETGRKVVALGDSFSQDQYLLAAQADEIWMHPMGMVDLSGYASYRNYYADALEKLKIDVHVFRSGTFKSALESLERSDMSDADRLATGDLLRELWSGFTAIVTERRKLPPDAVDHYANGLDGIFEKHAGNAAAAAMEYGFVDALKTRQEMKQELSERVGKDKDGGFSHIDFRDYLRAERSSLPRPGGKGVDAVGVIVASGMILDGEHPPGDIGGDSLAKRVRAATRDENIKALVLRIDSPGGSAFASEIIREALLEFRATGKPLVASMGSVAASGGYWIAAPANEIWASSTTITGSIGVLSAFPSISRSLEALGIHNDGLGTTAIAGGFDPARELSPRIATILRLANEHTYKRFIEIVAEGRDVDPQQIAAVAEGRVWTGAQAAANGLVDHLGDLPDAITAAARLAQLSQYDTRYIEEPRSWREVLLATLSMRNASWSALLMQNLFGIDPQVEPLSLLGATRDRRAQFALCIVCIRVP